VQLKLANLKHLVAATTPREHLLLQLRAVDGLVMLLQLGEPLLIGLATLNNLRHVVELLVEV
jgi:hypothetical protein